MKSFHRRAVRPITPALAAAPQTSVAREGWRADQLLVERGLAASRTAAQRMIEAGRVYWHGGAIAKAAQTLPENADLRVAANEDDRYVSRGGIKLAGALAATGVSVRDKVCLDLGQSTGGFTDCLLQSNAARVTGVDVGHAQLHQRLKKDARVVSLEGINARHLRDSSLAGQSFDLIVGDLAFISLTLILPQLPPLLTPHGDMLLLVKPQFEVGPAHIGKGGIVRDDALYPQVETKMREAAQAAGLRVLDYFPSSMTGTDGNREFFIWTQHERT
jgi:23S rRNA (cytidine1920-2'-O)/16S rRNA (cytidine1409-2'-O)-methyltransferase